MDHPSKDILGTKGQELKGKKIVLCITGSVAASECPVIARELMRHGAEIYAVMTTMAQKIINPNLMEWATGNPVVTRLTGKIEHIILAGQTKDRADLVLIAPATANTISKIACGIDDSTVTTIASTALGSKIPILIVPAMHQSLYDNPIVSENIKKLISIGVEFIYPKIEEGKAKIVNANDIVNVVIDKNSDADMRGLKILVTAGATVEYIDPIRIITNRSSGKMGVALAEMALGRGAGVTLVYGTGSATPPQSGKTVRVETTYEMFDEVKRELINDSYDILIAASAVADFGPETKFDYKISSRKTKCMNLKLRPSPKIIDKMKETCPGIFLVAFKAEHGLSDDKLIRNASELFKTSNADIVVANDVGRKGVGFGTDTNEVFVISRNDGVIHIPLSYKKDVADKILDIVFNEYKRNKIAKDI